MTKLVPALRSVAVATTVPAPPTTERNIPVNGDRAEVAGTQAYGDETGAATLTGGTWIVTRDQFFAFMALARSASPT